MWFVPNWKFYDTKYLIYRSRALKEKAWNEIHQICTALTI